MVGLIIRLRVVLFVEEPVDAADGVLVMLQKSESVLYLSDMTFF